MTLTHKQVERLLMEISEGSPIHTKNVKRLLSHDAEHRKRAELRVLTWTEPAQPAHEVEALVDPEQVRFVQDGLVVMRDGATVDTGLSAREMAKQLGWDTP